MNAIILVGGLGTRLRPLTLSTPKALLPILNKPFIFYQLEGLYRAGVRHIIFACGSQTPVFKKALVPAWGRKLKMSFARENSPLGTGGAIRFAYDAAGRKSPHPVIILNGDILFDIDFRKFIAHHEKKKSHGTIALTQVKDASRFGLVDTEGNGKIKKFTEKPKHARGPRWINAGAYILEPALIEMIPAGRPSSIEKEMFPRFLKARLNLFGLRTKEYWNDIGIPATYLQAHRDLWDQRNHWTEKSFLRKRGALIGRNCAISPSVSFKGPVSIGHKVVIKPGSFIQDSVIFDGVSICEKTQIIGSIIGSHCRIGENVQISQGNVIGSKSIINSFTRC